MLYKKGGDKMENLEAAINLLELIREKSLDSEERVLLDLALDILSDHRNFLKKYGVIRII